MDACRCLPVIEFCVGMLTKLPAGCLGKNKEERDATSGIIGLQVLMVHG